MHTTGDGRPRRDAAGRAAMAGRARRRRDEMGIALVSALLLMGLMSALLIGFFAMIQADQQAAGISRDQTQAYAAAHAGLEKLTADLGAVFIGGNYSPTPAQIAALTERPPAVQGFEFVAPDGGPGYTITQQPTVTATIPNGPFQGLQALLTPYQVDVVARARAATTGGAAEVKMRRVLQTAAVPVFQFGVYSENDLSFFAGPDFDFGGRVHSNQNVYLAQDGSATLTVRDVLTAVGEVVRTHLPNGLPLSTSGHRGFVKLATTSGSNPVFRPLSCGAGGGHGQGGNCGTGNQEGSVNVSSVPPATLQTVDGLPAMVLTPGNTANEPTWTNVATGTYNNRIRNGRTGAKRLDLPLVSDGAQPIDIVRRPSPTTPDIALVLEQRFFSMASLRILLSDRASDISGLQTMTPAPPVDLARLAKDTSYQATNNRLGTPFVPRNGIPLAQAGARDTGPGAGKAYDLPEGTPLEDGFIKIERQDREGRWSDVTIEILNLGFTGRGLANNNTWGSPGSTCAAGAQNDPNPNAVVRFQRVRDNLPTSPTDFSPCGRDTGGHWSQDPNHYIPMVFYDAREGARRDDPAGQTTSPKLAGIMHYVELDVNNLRQWIAASYPDTMDMTGYVVYFSDRRGNKNLGADGAAAPRAGADGVLYTSDDFGDDQETGELGFEDIVNPSSAQSVSNGVLDIGEDVNGNGLLDVYGGIPRQYPLDKSSYVLLDDSGNVVWSAAENATVSRWVEGVPVTLDTAVTVDEARVNPPVFFRRALKVVDGGYSGTLTLPHNGPQGLSIVSENPLYVQGNFNAPNGSGNDFGSTPGIDHVSAAVIADAVTLLSNNFNDLETFVAPHEVTNAARAASTTWYRMGVISGKGLSFPRPTSNAANDHTDFGTDGGAHNFLRYIENWTGDTLNYRGSIVSFFTNRQAVGLYKCCDVVYKPPTRGYKFDTEFLTPSLLPPRTPMFRDINTLTFRQLLRPNQ